MIRRILVSAFAMLLTTHLFASDVTVAPPPAGQDSNDGSQGAPFATIAKALGATASGDRILLRRGGTWRETFTLAGNRQLLAEPGTGTAPTITASTVAAGPWTTSGTLVSTPAAQQVLDVWVNGTFLHMARFPNTGYLRTEAGTTSSHIVSSELPARAAGRWTGAQVRWRRWSWWWETRPITTDSSTTTLELPAIGLMPETPNPDPDTNSPDGKESCFYIDNALSELDAPGEWFWGGGTLSLIPPAGVDPATMVVEIVTSTAGATCNGATIGGIAFRRFDAVALSVTGPSTVDGCTFEEIGDTAVSCSWGSAPTVVRNSIFRDVRNVAIAVNQDPAGPSGTLFERNLLHRIGTDRGYGGSGPWHAAGIILMNANRSVTRFNRIVATGYCGVIVGKAGQTIDRNILVRTMSTLNDGGAVYTNCSHTTITQNIILDTVGELETSMPWFPLGQGIWPEFLKDFHDQTITDNTVFGSNGNGIFMQDEYNCNISRNVVVDSRSTGLRLDYLVDNSTAINDYGVAENTDDDLRPQGHTMTGNIIATSSPNKRIVRPEHLTKWAPPNSSLVQSNGTVNYGIMDHTTFIASPTGVDLFTAKTPDRSWSTLADWAAGNTPWAQAGDRLVRGSAYLLINDTETTATMPVPAGAWKRHDGSAVGASLRVAPFRSAVLVTTGTLPSTPYTVASGIDWRADTPTTDILGTTTDTPTTGTVKPVLNKSGAVTLY